MGGVRRNGDLAQPCGYLRCRIRKSAGVFLSVGHHPVFPGSDAVNPSAGIHFKELLERKTLLAQRLDLLLRSGCPQSSGIRRGSAYRGLGRQWMAHGERVREWILENGALVVRLPLERFLLNVETCTDNLAGYRCLSLQIVGSDPREHFCPEAQFLI